VLGHHTCQNNQTNKLEIIGFENNTKRKHFNNTKVEEQQQQIKTLKKGMRQGWSRDGAVVRTLASHQCGPGSIPGIGGVLRFSPPLKNQHLQISIRSD